MSNRVLSGLALSHDELNVASCPAEDSRTYVQSAPIIQNVVVVGEALMQQSLG